MQTRSTFIAPPAADPEPALREAVSLWAVGAMLAHMSES